MLKSSIREHEPSYEEELGITTLLGPTSGRAASISGRPSGDHATSRDAFAHAERPGVLNSHNSTLLNVPQQETGQNFQLSSTAPAEDYMHDAVGG